MSALVGLSVSTGLSLFWSGSDRTGVLFLSVEVISSLAELNWISTSYVITFGCCILYLNSSLYLFKAIEERDTAIECIMRIDFLSISFC